MMRCRYPIQGIFGGLRDNVGWLSSSLDGWPGGGNKGGDDLEGK